MIESQLPFALTTVHCFWPSCPHVAESPDPHAAHDLMERHYAERHGDDLRRLGF